MKIKIVSDGTVLHTKVYDAESGKEIKRITEIKMIASVKSIKRGNMLMQCQITLLPESFEYEGPADIVQGEKGSSIRKVVEDAEAESNTERLLALAGEQAL
jgi:hypothetical protein